MKLRNLIFGLFLAIGAIGFTACTGDDGAQGPKGDQGEQGPPGEDGADAGAGSMESNYPFLKTWGKADGRIACDDPLLTEEGMFPGPDLGALTTTDAVRYALAGADAAADGYVLVQCSGDVFDPPANPDIDGDGAGDLDPYTVGDNRLLFVKTHRGGDMNPVPQDGGRAPVSGGLNGETSTVQKTFTGGMFFAKMNATNVAGEVADRRDLYRDCDKGTATAPPELRGEWRAVHIEEKTWNTRIDAGFVAPVDNTTVTETTKKVCIRLDSLPGTVKCYVREEVDVPDSGAIGVAAGIDDNQATEKIIIYGDGTDPMVVDPKAAAAAGTTNKLLGPTDATEEARFISTTATAYFQGAKLCNLFSEAEE